MGDGHEIVGVFEHAFGQQEARGQLEIVPRRPERHRYGLALYANLQGLLHGDEVVRPARRAGAAPHGDSGDARPKAIGAARGTGPAARGRARGIARIGGHALG